MNLFKKQDDTELNHFRENSKRLQTVVDNFYRSQKDSDQNHVREILDLEATQQLELREKEFKLKHFKDEEIKVAKEEVIKISKELAVLKKENEMLKSITDVNADIIDVKDLMNKLVEKLPSIDLKSLTINNTEKK